VSRAVEVTIFERSALPGGLWQSDGASEVSIYDNLWTNGASHSHEFSDYTYDEHFGRPGTFLSTVFVACFSFEVFVDSYRTTS